MRVTEECLGPNPWAIDSCGRQLLQIDECDPARPCMDGRCFGDGDLCTQCEGDIDCADGFRCIGYAAYPEVPRVCVPESDCNEDPNAMCPDGLECSPVGVCWMSITPTCRQDGDRWGVDTCNRDVFKIEECPANSLCRDDRCVGGGELCDVCQQDGDCTDGYVCGAYNEFPNVPAACVPESNCHIDPNVTCPEPLVCQDNGICAFAISLGCVEPNAIGRVDTCGRTLEALFLCPANSVCQDGRCMNASGGIPSSGGSPDTGGQQVGGGGTQSLVAGEPSQGGRVQSRVALGGGRSSMGGAAGGGGAPIRTVPQALRARPAIMAVLVRVVSVARWAALSKGCQVETARLVEARSLSNRRRVGNDATPKERHAVSCHCRKQPNDIEWARSI